MWPVGPRISDHLSTLRLHQPIHPLVMVHNHYIYNDTPRLKIFIVGQKYFKPLPADLIAAVAVVIRRLVYKYL